MADKIKGLTVQIGGDTTKLSQALTKVNGSIKTTKTALTEVNKLLKLDPKNTDLLREKQSLLAQQIEKTKDKLSALKQAQEQAKEQLANGEIDQGAYDNLQKKIEKTETELERLEQEAEKTKDALGGAFQHAGEKMQEAGEKITEVGNKLKKLSALSAGALTGIIKTTADFDSSMSQVAAISGATGSDFNALRDKAREMGETTKFSASEAADAMNYMAMAGWKTEDMLGGIEGIMYLAAASGEDLATTSDIVTDALTAMGYSAEDAGHLADVMAAASSNANTNVAMMGETFKYAAAVGGSYGYTMEDIALATGLMANAGIKGSQAGTALRSIMTRLATDAGASSKKLGALGVLTKRLGVEFYDTEGNMRPFRDVIIETRDAWAGLSQEEQASYANTIAGKNAMSGWLALMNAAEEDVTKLADAIDNSNGTAQEMSEIMQDNLRGQLTILKSQLSELAISIGDTMMPTIREIVTKIQEFVDWLNSLDDSTKQTIGTALTVTAALAPVLIIIGNLVTAIGTIMKVMKPVKVAIGTIMTVMNPFTVAIGAVTAAMIVLGVTAEDAYEEARKLSEEEQANVDTVNGLTESYDQLAEARKTAVAGAVQQANKEQHLWEQLQAITDENGNILEGNEDLAEYLTGELAEALGIEIEIVDGQIKKYNELVDSIDAVIEKKKAEALLNSMEGAYTEALTNRIEAYNAVATAQQQVTDETERLAEAEAELERIQRERDEAVEQEIASAINATDARRKAERVEASYEGQIRQASDAVEGHKDKLEELQGTLTDAEAVYGEYNATVENYENLTASVVSGKEKEMSDAVFKTATNFKTAATASKGELEQQRDKYKSIYDEMKKQVDSGATDISQKQIDEAKRAYQLSEIELNKSAEAVKTTADDAVRYANSDKGKVQNAIRSMFDSSSIVNQGKTWGADFMSNMIAGINSKKPVLSQVLTGVANLYKKTLGHSVPEEGPMRDELTWMPDFMQNLAKGIDANKWRVLQEAQGLAADLKKTLNVSVTGGSMNANINNRTTIELDGRVIADVVNKNMGALV